MTSRKPVPADAPKTYKVLVGMDYRSTETDEYVRREPGDVINDFPPHSARHLIGDGALEETEA